LGKEQRNPAGHNQTGDNFYFLVAAKKVLALILFKGARPHIRVGALHLLSAAL
jgi:hypothetical protein